MNNITGEYVGERQRFKFYFSEIHFIKKMRCTFICHKECFPERSETYALQERPDFTILLQYFEP